jgi:hypothetical protein
MDIKEPRNFQEMKQLFKSDELQAAFEKDGFVKLSLLDSTQVTTLVQGYEQFREAHERIKLSYITTSHSSDPKLITAVDEMLQATIAPAIAAHMMDYKLLFGNYLVKMPAADSATPPHQDITFVDEQEFTSVNIWIALQDIDVENGSMYFLRGSHRYIPTLRPTHDYKWAYENVKKEVTERSVTFCTRAGEAFVFDHSIVHGSHANRSGTPRLAAVMGAYSFNAALIHYFLPDIGSNKLEKYSMTKNAYLYFQKQQPPLRGVRIGEEEFDFHQLSIQEFDRISGQKPTGLIQKIKNVLNAVK